MIIQELLQQRRTALIEIMRASFGVMLHSDAFVVRLLGAPFVREIRPDIQLSSPVATNDTYYEGFPRVAYLGFTIGAAEITPDDLVQEFMSGIKRLQHRSTHGQATLARDDVALLGIADGLSRMNGQPVAGMVETREWLLQLINEIPARGYWSDRIRSLAADLIDQRGRLQMQINLTNEDVLALDSVLRVVWPEAFRKIPSFEQGTLTTLIETLLTSSVPQGELERAAIWFKCLEVLIGNACESLSPSISDTARILASVQHAFKRWAWKAKSRRKNTMPSRWLIDDEYDVQSLLWTVLYPIYGAALVDETYLPSWGNVQPRVDLGITTLKLIIEVKIAREPADFVDIEEQVAGDAGIYFKDTSQYDRMIVFVYDDCDKSYPEKYDSLKNALRQRDRIEDIIIVRRPSMIPNRGDRSE